MEANAENKNLNNAVMLDFPPLPEEKDYVVCYVDFLGSKRNIDKTGEKSFFENIHDAFSFALNVESKLKIFGDLQFKVFSDNILIAHEVSNSSDKGDIYQAYKNITLFLKSFAPRFIQQGVLFRGGITYGKLAINDVMVWGGALVNAVKIEENIAIYPRIVVSQELLNVFALYGLDEYDFEEKFSCLRDNDGCVFVDYVHYSEPPIAEITISEGYCAVIEKIQDEDSPKILQKYNWHKKYLERAKEIHNDISGECFYVEFDNQSVD